MTIAEFVDRIGFDVDQNSLNNVNNTVNGLKSTITKALGAIGIGFSLSSLNAIAEEFNQINDRVNAIVGEEQDAKEVEESILAAANECKVSYSDMASDVESLVNANSELFPIDDATAFVEEVNKLGKAAGYSDGEISSMQSTLQRIVASGEVSSSTITRMLRTTPALANQLAEALGVSTTELSNMAAAGQITVETIKDAILDSTDSIDQAFNNLNYSISDATLNIRNQWGFFVDDFNSTLEISQTIARGMVTAFSGLMGMLNDAADRIYSFNDALGGGNSLFKAGATVAAAFFAVMAFPKIISQLKSFLSLFNLSNLAVLGLIAFIAALGIAVDDFINFMQGNDSVIGYCFEQAGIDVEEMRQSIINAWENLKTFFKGIWSSIKAIFQPAIDWIKQKLEDVFGEDLFSGLGEGMAAVVETIERVTGELANNTDLQDFIAKIVVAIPVAITAFNTLVSVVKTASKAFTTIHKAVKTVEGVFKTVHKAVDKVNGVFKQLGGKETGNVSKALEKIRNVFTKVKGAVETVAKAFQGLSGPMKAVSGVVAILVGAFITLWTTSEEFRENIIGTFKEIVNKIKDFVQGIKDRLGEIDFSVVTDALHTVKGVFDTVTSAIKKVWEKFCEVLAPVFEGGFSIVSDILGTVFDVITGLLDVFIGLFTGDWSQCWEGIKEVFSGIWDGISGIASDVLGIIQGVIDTFLGWVGTSWEEVWDGVTSFFSGVFETISGTIGDIAETIQSGIQTAIDFITSLPEQALSWGADLINGIIEGIKGAIGGIADAVSGVAETIKGFLHFSAPDEGPLSDYESWMPDFMNGLASGITSNSGVVTDALNSMMNMISTSVQEGFSVIQDSFLTAWQTVGESTGEAMSVVQDAVIEGLENAQDGVRAATNDIVSVMNESWKEAQSGTTSVFTQIGSSMSSLMNSAKSQVISICNSLKTSMVSTLNGVPGQFKTIGQNIMTGLVNGINAGKSAVVNAMKTSVSSAVTAAKKEAKISSPSKVMEEEVGQYLPEGMAEGIEKNSASAANAMADVVSDSSDASGMISGIVASINANKDQIAAAVESAMGGMSVFANANMVAPATAMTAMGGSTNNSRNVSQSVNINNTFNGDRAIQQKAASTMNQSADDIIDSLSRALSYTR